MRRLTALAAIAWLSLGASAWAACAVATMQAKDNTGATANYDTINHGASGCAGIAGVVGNAGAILDAAGQNVAAPANSLQTGGQFNTTPTTITSGNFSPLQLDSAANLLVNLKTALPVGANTIGGVTQSTSPWVDNISQLGGNAIKTNSGTGSAGSLNVYIATDQPSLTNTQPGQFVSIGPVGSATAVSTGNGTTNAGDQRTNIASDNSAIANWGQGATGSAVPSGAVYLGGNGSGNLTGVTVCDNIKVVNFSSTTQQLMVAGVSAKKVHICAINLVVAAATNVALIEGTTVTNPCDTGAAGMAGGATAATGWNFAANGGIAIGTGIGQVFVSATAADNVCLVASAVNQVSGSISYTVY